MTFSQGLLPIGNGFNICTYKENDAHINRKPIQELDQLYINNVIADRYYSFDFTVLGFDFVPFSCWVYSTSGSSSISSLRLQVDDKNSGASIFDIPLATLLAPMGNQTYSYSFPFLVFSKAHVVRLISDMDLHNCIIFGEKTVLNKAIFPLS